MLVHGLPLFHQHGLGGVGASLLAGGRAVLHSRFDPEAVCATIAAERATVFLAVPAMYERLVGWDGFAAADLSSLRLLVSGSAPLSPGLAERVAAALGELPLERYGSTEAGLCVSNLCDGPRRAGSVGFLLPGLELALADGDGDGDGEGEGDLALAEAETVDLRDIAAVAADRIAAAAAGDGAGLDGRPLALPPAQGHADEVAADRTRAVVEGHPPAESHAVAESYGAGKTHGAAEYYGAGGYDEDYDDEDYDDAEEYGAGGHGATGYGAAGYGAAGYAAHGYDAHGHDGTGHGTDGYGGADGDGIGEYADGIEARGEPGAVADVGHGWSDADSDFGDEDERPFRSSGRPTARPPGGRPTTSRPGRVQVNPPGSHGGLTAGPRVSAPSSSVPPASQPASQPAPAVGPDDGEDVDGYTHRRAVGS